MSQGNVRAGEVWFCNSLGVEVTATNVTERGIEWSDGFNSSQKYARKLMTLIERVAGKPHYLLIDGEWVKQ